MQEGLPTISIVIPTRDSERTLAQCLESARPVALSYTDIHFLIEPVPAPHICHFEDELILCTRDLINLGLMKKNYQLLNT